MKKHLSKLDDLVQAARTEEPIVSFEETARQVRLMAEKQRKPLWTLLRDAWAFPLYQIQRLTKGFALHLPSENAWSVAMLMRGSLVRGFAGVCAAVLVMTVFPSLVHDLSYEILMQRIANGKMTESQTASKLSSEGNNATTVNNNLTQKNNQTKRLGQMALFASANTLPPSKPEGSIFSTSPVAVIADSVVADSTLKNSTMQSNPSFVEYGIAAVLRKNSADIAMNVPSTTNNSKTSNSIKSGAKASNELGQEPVRTANEAAKNLTPPSEKQEPEQSFWQRVSLEARIAARTDIGTQVDNVVNSSQARFSANQDQRPFSQNNTAATPLQNLALGMYYAVNEHHTLGIEGGSEPFFTAQMQQVTQAPDMQGGTNSFVGITSTPSGTNPSSTPSTNRTQTVPVRSASNRTWFGAAYQYNAEAWDILGGVQPLARITLGGGELGAVGRTLVGAKFLSRERFSFVLAGEGAAVASQLLGTWNLTPRLGVTLGLSVKF